MIEMGKKYQTREGKPVRILCVDGPGPQPVVGVVAGEDSVDTWYTNGKYDDDPDYQSQRDLIPVPEKHEGWVIVPNSGKYVDSAIYTHAEAYELTVGDKEHHIARLEWEA